MQLGGKLVRLFVAREVGAPHAPDEERIASEYEPGLIGASTIPDEIAHAFWRMPGRMQRADKHIPQLDLVAVIQAHMRKEDVCSHVEVDSRAGSLAERHCTG